MQAEQVRLLCRVHLYRSQDIVTRRSCNAIVIRFFLRFVLVIDIFIKDKERKFTSNRLPVDEVETNVSLDAITCQEGWVF